MRRSWILRWPILLAVLAALLLGASGCGGIQATSWTGMTIDGDKIYVANLQQIQILDAETGDPVRAFPENPEESNLGTFYTAPVLGEGYMIVTSYFPSGGLCPSPGNLVLKLDLETGTELWRFDGAQGQYIEAGAIGGDTFVIGNSDGNIYALDVENGELKWKVPTGHRVWATPLIVEDTVYIGSMDHNLYALSLSDGSERWKFAAGGAFASRPALQDGVLYIGAFDNRLYAIDAATGTERWHFSDDEGNAWFWGEVAVRDGVVYAADVRGNVYALDAQSGQEIWHRPLEKAMRAGPTLTEDGETLLVTAENGTLYALDTADGVKKGSEEGEGRGFVAPIVQGDMVYEIRIHGPYQVRALELLDGGERYSEVWRYPPETEAETEQ